MALLSENRSGRAYRIGDLLGMRAVATSGRVLGVVTDVRVSWRTDRSGRAEFLVDGFVVGSRRAGSLLGYDRRQEQRPAAVRVLVRRLHRHTVLVPWADVSRIDWPDRVVRLSVEAGRPLTTDVGDDRGERAR